MERSELTGAADIVLAVGARWIAVVVAALLLVILVLAFFRYARRGHGHVGADDDLRRVAVRAGEDTKVCPDCAANVALDLRLCPHCGHAFT
jgi:hypothetical protein